ncbi:MAG: hypothetical protein ABI728_01420, partial [Betaproteobacteria bacterium]
MITGRGPVDGTGASTTPQLFGVRITGGSLVESVAGGAITISGDVRDARSAGIQGVAIDASTVSGGTANIGITGIGGATRFDADGVQLTSGSHVSTTTGNIVITGSLRPYAGGKNVEGVAVVDGSRVTTGSGNITIDGTGPGVPGTLADTSNSGVAIANGGIIESLDGGSISIVGDAGFSANGFASGVFIGNSVLFDASGATGTPGAPAQVLANSGGNVTITGFAGSPGPLAGTNSSGIAVIGGGSLIEAQGGGSVSLLGYGPGYVRDAIPHIDETRAGAGRSQGVYIADGANIGTQTGNGTLTIAGFGGVVRGFAGPSFDGPTVLLGNLSGVSFGNTYNLYTDSGSLHISGEAGYTNDANALALGFPTGTSAQENSGTFIGGGGSASSPGRIFSSSGDIFIDGAGGGTAANPIARSAGLITYGFIDISTGTGNSIYLSGNGGITKNGETSALVFLNSSVSLRAGAVNLTGIGGTSANTSPTARYLAGVDLSNSNLTVQGNLNIVGIGGNAIDGTNPGVWMHGNSSISVTTPGAAINITGTGGGTGATTGFNNENDGLRFESGTTITSTSGAVNLIGQAGAGGTSNGVAVGVGSSITTAGGSILVRADSGDVLEDGNLNSAGGNISVESTAGSITGSGSISASASSTSALRFPDGGDIDLIAAQNINLTGDIISDGYSQILGDSNRAGSGGIINIQTNGTVTLGFVSAVGGDGARTTHASPAGGDGGEITISGVGSIDIDSLNAYGGVGATGDADEFDAGAGGHGGNVHVTGTRAGGAEITIGSIHTSGGGGGSRGFDGGAAGGDAGDIVLTTNGSGQSIEWFDALFANGGDAGNGTSSTPGGAGGAGAVITLTASGAVTSSGTASASGGFGGNSNFGQGGTGGAGGTIDIHTQNGGILSVALGLLDVSGGLAGNGLAYGFGGNGGFVAVSSLDASAAAGGVDIGGLSVVANGGFDAFPVADGLLTINAGTLGISQTGPLLSNVPVSITSAGTTNLAGDNQVGTIAATVTGQSSSFTFNNVGDLIIGVAGNVHGVTTADGTIKITANPVNCGTPPCFGGFIDVFAPVTAHVSTAPLLTDPLSDPLFATNGPAIHIQANGLSDRGSIENDADITVIGRGGILVAAPNGGVDVNWFGATGNHTVSAPDAVIIRAGSSSIPPTYGRILNDSKLQISSGQFKTDITGSNVKLSASGDIIFPGSITATTGNVTISAVATDIAAGETLFLTGETGPTGRAVTTGAITGNLLTLATNGDARLTDLANSVSALNATQTGIGNIDFTNNKSLDIAGITSGSGTISLNVRGDITQSSPIAANSVLLEAVGSATLNNQQNVIGSVAGNVHGNLWVTSLSPLQLGDGNLNSLLVGGNLLAQSRAGSGITNPASACDVDSCIFIPNGVTAGGNIEFRSNEIDDNGLIRSGLLDANYVRFAPWTPGTPLVINSIDVSNYVTPHIQLG